MLNRAQSKTVTSAAPNGFKEAVAVLRRHERQNRPIIACLAILLVNLATWATRPVSMSHFREVSARSEAIALATKGTNHDTAR